ISCRAWATDWSCRQMKFDPNVIWLIYPFLLKGAAKTLLLSVVVLMISTTAGLLIAIGMLGKSRLLRGALGVASWVARGIPPLMILLIVFLGLPKLGLVLSPFSAATIGMSAYVAFYFAEAFSAGFASIPREQFQAASALALPRLRVLRRIIIPQMLPAALPSYFSRATEIVKGTSIAAVVAFPEMATSAKQVIAATFRPIETLLIISVVYIILNGILLVLQAHFEMRLKKRRD
ncbi:amino acid ABC transporter permease, partial [Mesorhizobium sp. M7D.F.Ca.US.004.03.1.1]|uniref:amino acid ABC transporter permease n=1 Tax=Mesorhizobium sp. M7D.F.Ca.US.004.03.1.1 TaxID=2496702 RepID=UPI0019D1C8FC